MHNFFGLLQNIASIILATSVLACRIVLSFESEVPRHVYPDYIFFHCKNRETQNFIFALGK